MRKYLLLCFAAFLSCSLSFSQPIHTRTGQYTYVAPLDQSIEMAKKIALDKAKISIIEEEYGTVVGINNVSRTTNENGVSSSSFLSVGELEVKGEWLGTVGEPVFNLSFSGDNLVVKVTVTGKIREIKSSSVELNAKILRNGIDKGNESNTFKNDDHLFILFRTPIKGYVAVYQYDSDGVFRLLPYSGAEGSGVPVKSGVDYLFFDRASSQSGVSDYSYALKKNKPESNYLITCQKTQDLCRYYIIFSPNEFAIANDVIDNPNDMIPATVNIGTFQKWMMKAKKHDKDMIVLIKDITLTNK